MRSWTSTCGQPDPRIRVRKPAAEWIKSSRFNKRHTFKQSRFSYISIIAVQRLGANPYYTWVKKVPRKGDSTMTEEVMWVYIEEILESS